MIIHDKCGGQVAYGLPIKGIFCTSCGKKFTKEEFIDAECSKPTE